MTSRTFLRIGSEFRMEPKLDMGVNVVDLYETTTKEIREEFHKVKKFFLDRLNKNEKLKIVTWYAGYVYFEVHDTTIKEYPNYCRALVSFDFSNGKIASPDSENWYQFARKGWISRITELIGHDCTVYS